MKNHENDIEKFYGDDSPGGFHKGLLGMILAGFGLTGIIFSGLIQFGFASFYGKLGVGSTPAIIPFSLSILLIVVGAILLFLGQKHRNENI